MNGKTIRFCDFLAQGNIICGLESPDNISAIKELCGRLAANTAGIDPDKIFGLVAEREKLFPTVIAPGLAVPHARMEDIPSLLVALGISREGIDFNAPGMPPVKVVILVITPKDDPGLHLQVLSALAKDFSDPTLTDKISSLSSCGEVMDVFRQAERQFLPDYLTAADIMNRGMVTLGESDTLNKAIEIFATRGIFDIPIVDDEHDIRGVISVEDVLRLSLPEHILWMNDLSPILNFQPFAELLRNDRGTKITDFMRTTYVSVDMKVPAVQLAKIFLTQNARHILVTADGKLAGTVRLSDFIRRFFWE